MWEFWQDVCFAIRITLRRPGFTLVAILTLSLGVGSSILIFSIINSVLLRPPAFHRPEQLVHLYNVEKDRGEISSIVSYPDFLDWQQQSDEISELAGFSGGSQILDGIAGPQLIMGARVTSNFFSLLGVRALLGQTLGLSDQHAGEHIVLGYGFWRREFGASTTVVGTRVEFREGSYTIIGVLPPDVRFDLLALRQPEFWITLRVEDWQRDRNGRSLRVIGRLKPESTVAKAQAEMDVIAARLARLYPENVSRSVQVFPLEEPVVAPVRPALQMLLIAVGLFLLIACTNVANLLLTQGMSREQEVAVRLAFGASRWRLIRQLLVECLLLTSSAAVFSMIMVSWGIRGLLLFLPENLPRADEIAVDRSVALFAFSLALVTSIVTGLMPALHATRPDLTSALKQAPSLQGVRKTLARKILVTGELALSLLLLSGAGLLLNSFIQLVNADPGYSAQNVITLSLRLLSARPEIEVSEFLNQMVNRIRQIPTVEEAGVIDSPPFSSSFGQHRVARGELLDDTAPFDANEELTIEQRVADAGYFRTLKIPILEGRNFGGMDLFGSPSAVLLSRQLARELWPQESAVGKKTRRGAVIGVVGDVRYQSLERKPPLVLYRPAGQAGRGPTTLVVRTSTDPMKLIPALRSQILDIENDTLIHKVALLEQHVADSLADRRFLVSIVTAFAGMALLLSTVGIYGVISYSLTLRMHELGVRKAIGAQPLHLFKLILGEGLPLIAIGLAIGMLLTVALTRFLGTLLYAVNPLDPWTIAAVSAVLVLSALLACVWPARRAIDADAGAALRSE